jgi:hypothetical protein
VGSHRFIPCLSSSGILMGLQENMRQIVRHPLYFIILGVTYYTFSFIPLLSLDSGFFHYDLGNLEGNFSSYGLFMLCFHVLECFFYSLALRNLSPKPYFVTT